MQYERASKLQIVLWCLIAYIVYVAACFAMESYGRSRFSVQRRAEIERIAGRKAHLLAETRRATSLSEMEEWLPYKAMMFGSLTVWGILAIAAGVAAARSMWRSGGGVARIAPIKFLALGIAIPALFVFMIGILPPSLAGNLWETQMWMTWPV